jgi:hypothetical protein
MSLNVDRDRGDLKPRFSPRVFLISQCGAADAQAVSLLCLCEGGLTKLTMINVKNIILIILVAVVFGTLMGYRADMQFGWQSAVIAALAFGVLGLLISYFSARRRK